MTVVIMAVFILAGCAVAEDHTRSYPPQPKAEERPQEMTEVALTPPIVRINPRTLVGLDEDQIRKILGEPVTVKEEAPSRVWGYDVGSCSLDLFFYLDLGTSKFRALTYTVSTYQQSRREEVIESCVGLIQTKNRGPSDKS